MSEFETSKDKPVDTETEPGQPVRDIVDDNPAFDEAFVDILIGISGRHNVRDLADHIVRMNRKALTDPNYRAVLERFLGNEPDNSFLHED